MPLKGTAMLAFLSAALAFIYKKRVREYLTEKLAELLTDSADEIQKDLANRPQYVLIRVYARIKMICGVIDTLQAMGLLVLSDQQMAAYLDEPGGFRYNCWEILWRHGALNPRQCCHLLMAQIEHFCAKFPPSS
jgi:hypothetical protein